MHSAGKTNTAPAREAFAARFYAGIPEDLPQAERDRRAGWARKAYIPVFRDPHWPAAKVGTALVGAFAEMDIYFGQEYRIDVSSEAGSRFDQNITGFRAEEDLAFDARPYVFTGKLQQVTGL